MARCATRGFVIPFLLVIHRAPNANINTLLTLTELKSIVDNILKLPVTLPPKASKKNMKVTNTFTNEILYFDSLGKAAIHFYKPKIYDFYRRLPFHDLLTSTHSTLKNIRLNIFNPLPKHN